MVLQEFDRIQTLWYEDRLVTHHPWIARISQFQSLFLLCRQIALAHEGALKLKELAYVHAEAYHVGSLKHGPFAMLDGKTAAVLLLCLDSAQEMEEWSVYQEIRARDTTVFCIITDRHYLFAENVPPEDRIMLHQVSEMHPVFVELLTIVHVQWIACLTSIYCGHSPDFPRNLAKTVTVL